MNESAAQSTFSLAEWWITPWTMFFLFLLPLLMLMRFGKTYPSGRSIVLTSIVVANAIVILWVDWWWMVVSIMSAVFALIATIDLLTIPSTKGIEVKRQMARVASLGNSHPAEFIIDSRVSQTFLHRYAQRVLRGLFVGKVGVRAKLRLAEDASDGLQVEPAVHEIDLLDSKRITVQHSITPHRRGAFELEYAYAELSSLFGLWCHQHEFRCKSTLHVYPDIKQIGKYALLARTNRLTQIGVRRTRKAGQDNDFERLRDYSQDDNYKHIDWRSTARRQKLTVRQFQTDQSQRVIFMLDCGRMMTNEYNGLSLLDYALNSVLMLSYVALDQGDSVGMVSFSDQVHTFVPPAGGRRQMNRILHAGFDQFPQLEQSRFDEAFLYLSKHCRRRSLVVLVTNVIDQVNGDQIQNYMKNLIGCHLPLLVLLRDHRIFQAADNPAPDPRVLYRSAAAADLLVWRNQVIRQMKTGGSLALDVYPEEMTTPLVNQYLEVKARHLL